MDGEINLERLKALVYRRCGPDGIDRTSWPDEVRISCELSKNLWIPDPSGNLRLRVTEGGELVIFGRGCTWRCGIILRGGLDWQGLCFGVSIAEAIDTGDTYAGKNGESWCHKSSSTNQATASILQQLKKNGIAHPEQVSQNQARLLLAQAFFKPASDRQQDLIARNGWFPYTGILTTGQAGQIIAVNTKAGNWKDREYDDY